MAQLPVEVARVGGASVGKLEEVLALLNRLQDAFKFGSLADDEIFRFQGASDYCYTTQEIYDLFEEFKRRVKGYHPHLIGVVERRLDGQSFSNLFGSMRKEGARVEGMAIVSLYGIPQLLSIIPTDVYLVFEFLSFALRFLYGEGLIHDERRGCVFDRKVDKREIVEAIKVGRFCASCEEAVRRTLDSDQEIAVERIFRLVRDFANSQDPQGSWNAQLEQTANPMPRVFLCHSSRDKEFVRRIATNLVDAGCRVGFDAWEIRVGDNIVQKINDGLNESDVLAVVLSHAAMESEWVRNEWSSKFMMAADERKARVFPLLLEDCKIPPLLKPIKYADFRKADRYDSALSDVLEAVWQNARDAA